MDFSGKRYNVLRNRVDSWEYDMDQLLFGTILFTLLAFLFPAVLVYYALFAIVRSYFLVPDLRLVLITAPVALCHPLVTREHGVSPHPRQSLSSLCPDVER